MSLPQGTRKDLNPNPNPNSNSPHHHQHLNPPDGIIDGDLSPDPLLQSGAFIDATATTTSNSHNLMETGKAQSNGVESTSVSSGVTTDGSAGRVKSKGLEPQAMDWLPAGWTVEYKVRSSGATAGSTDRYYHDPASGRRFRSKKEVLHFLETGMIKKNVNSEKTSVEGSASKKQKKSSKKPRPAVNFDFFDVPAKVEWVLTDSSHWTWTPFIGDKKVPESTAQEWAAAFTVFTIQQSGRTQ